MFEAALQQRDADVENGYAVSAIGLQVLRELTRTEWTELGQHLRERAEGSQWALGDWLVYGGREPGNSWIGSGYARAAEITGYSTAYLSSIYVTAKAFSPDSRYSGIVFTLYLRIAQQPEALRGELVTLCLTHKWSHQDLDTYLHRDQPVRMKAAPKQRRRRPLNHVRCPKCSHEFPVKGHLVKTDV